MTAQGRILVTIKQFLKEHYAWPGGYEIHLVLEDGEVLCHACTQKHVGLIFTATAHRLQDGWASVGTDINYEDTDLFCAHCGQQITPAYV